MAGEQDFTKLVSTVGQKAFFFFLFFFLHAKSSIFYPDEAIHPEEKPQNDSNETVRIPEPRLNSLTSIESGV